MSHTSSIKSVSLTSIEALTAAVAELNTLGVKCSLEKGGKPRAYYDNQEGMGEADYVLRLPNARYDVGLYKTAAGNYEPRTDFFGGTVAQQLGCPGDSDQARLGKLFQLYGIHATAIAARRQGLSVQRRALANGTVQMVLTGASL